MGCGSSTGTTVVTPSKHPIDSIPSSTNGEAKFHTSNGSLSTNHLNQQKSSQALPPPKPPGNRKADLLQNQSRTHGQYDPRRIFPSANETLEDFAKSSLIPDETADLYRNVKITEITKPNKNGTAKPANANPSSDTNNGLTSADDATSPHARQEDGKPKNTHESATAPTTTSSTEFQSSTSQRPPAKPERGAAQASFHVPTVAYEDQVKKQLEEYAEQQKRASEKRESEKKMRQQTLKEKLKKRSEMKQKQRREAAAAEKANLPTEETVSEPPVEKETQDTSLEPVPSEEAPQPAIPVTKKEILYKEENIELFGDLEKYAVQMEKITSESVTFATLMDNLLITQLSDLEKVRILFHWITAQDLNSINFPSQVQEDTPLGFLLAIKEDRKTYASLFVRLCGAAKLHGKLITGYLKGVGYFPDYKFGGSDDPFRGSWNAVLIDGQWRLIDNNWGARHVTEDDEKTSESWKTEYKYEEHYFLTDPDQLINTHFPDEVDWQLLETPYTKNDFERSVKLWPLFYKLKLSLFSHKEGLIAVDGSGYVKIQLKISPFARTDAQFKAELKPRFKESNQDLELLRRSVFHYTEVDLETFEIFLPSTGQYIFKIFALSSKFGEPNVYTNLCFYQINCPKITSSPPTPFLPPFPVVNTCYGLSVVDSQMVARTKSHKGARIECDENGEATVVLSVVAKDKNIAFTHDLYDSAYPTNSLTDRVVHSHSDHNGLTEVTFFVRVPRPGTYALALFSNVGDTSSTTFTPFCYYLLTSTKQKQESAQFPRIPNKIIGRLQPGFNELSLDFKSCHPQDRCDWRTGILRTDDNGECCLFLSHSTPLTVVVEFSSHVDNEFSDYASVETTGNSTAVSVRPPVHEIGNSPCCLKIYASKINQSGNLPSVYVGIVFASATNPKVLSFPQCPIRTWGPAGITSLKYGLKKIEFKNSQSALEKMCDDLNFKIGGPTRNYDGGEDFVLDLELSRPLQLKAKVQNINGNSENLENYVLLEKAGPSSAVVRIRFLQTGTFSLVVYACAHDDKSGQLSPLVYSLVSVSAPSSCTLAFPIAFGVWGSSACQLFEPLSLELERNRESTVKLFLAKYQESDGLWSSAPYSEVMAVVDGNQPVTNVTTSDCNYEWTYFPGPGEKVLGILVKPEADSDAMTYALQFKIM